jgi:hypothetical protein
MPRSCTHRFDHDRRHLRRHYPKATLDAIGPAFAYFTASMALCGCAFLFFGFEAGRQSIAAIDGRLVEKAPVRAGE